MTQSVLIHGLWSLGDGAELISTNPANGQMVWSGKSASAAQAAAAVASARSAFAGWAATPRQERIAILKRYQEILKARAELIAHTLSNETGKALWETKAEAASMAGKVDVSIRAFNERTGERTNTTAFGRATLRHRPHGVAVVLGPYNFPGHLPNGHIVPALLAGDTVVFKPSEETPHTGQILVECLTEARLPAGVINLVQGGREVGQALLEQPIDALFFTGSGAAGAHFRRQFADNPHIILALELGGNNPLVVWDATSPEAAASLIVQSAFVTTGQRCSCARRVILPDTGFGRDVIEATKALTERLIIGEWTDNPEPYMGPLISARAADGAIARADHWRSLGAKGILAFGALAGRGGAFVTPGIMDATDVSLPDEEIFAPLITIKRVSSFDAAISEANATHYGLSAGLISNEAALWETFSQQIRAGVVNWNRPTTGAAADMPFGGLGASGNHRPSAYYAADYCAYPVASFEADQALDITAEFKGLKA